jgi:hypothetical protein
MPINISAERDRVPEALQLRVRDVVDERVREALRAQESKGEPSLTKIESMLAGAKARGTPPDIPRSTAFRIGRDLTLMRGCHRTCAIYLLNPPAFELLTIVVPDDEAWSAYFDPRLAVS